MHSTFCTMLRDRGTLGPVGGRAVSVTSALALTAADSERSGESISKELRYYIDGERAEMITDHDHGHDTEWYPRHLTAVARVTCRVIYNLLMANMLTKLIESVNWRLFTQTVRRVQEAFADLPVDELNSLIDEAVASSRAGVNHRERASGG